MILTVWGHMTFKWQQRSIVVELDWPHSIARSPKPPIRRKDLADISSKNRVIAHFILNFVAMATRESPG